MKIDNTCLRVQENCRDDYVILHTPDELRCIFFQLVAAAAIEVPIARLLARCICLITGSWVEAGYKKAENLWIQECIKFSGKHPLPRHRFYRIVAVSIATELVKDLVKCVTLPFAALGLIFAALWGVWVPMDARDSHLTKVAPSGAGELWAKIEDLWSIALPKWANTKNGFSIINCQAFCMQTKAVWKRDNLFQYDRDYDSQDPRSLILSLKKLNAERLGELDDIGGQLSKWNKEIKKTLGRKAAQTRHTQNVLGGLLEVYNQYKKHILASARAGKLLPAAPAEAFRTAVETVDRCITLLRYSS